MLNSYETKEEPFPVISLVDEATSTPLRSTARMCTSPSPLRYILFMIQSQNSDLGFANISHIV